MTKSVMLKTTSDFLRQLERGITGFVNSEFNGCYLFLADGGAIKASIWGIEVAPKFECFSLVLDTDQVLPEGAVTEFVTHKGNTAVSILLREEYSAAFSGDQSGLVGRNPQAQTSAKPGHVPKNALVSCLVAYGLLIEGVKGRLVVAADWFPYKIEAITDEAKISEALKNSEAVPVSRYSQQYGLL